MKFFIQFTYDTTEAQRTKWNAPDAKTVVVTPAGCFILRDPKEMERVKRTGKVSTEALMTMEPVAGCLDALAIADELGVHTFLRP